jgi:hypothetical protein
MDKLIPTFVMMDGFTVTVISGYHFPKKPDLTSWLIAYVFFMYLSQCLSLFYYVLIFVYAFYFYIMTSVMLPTE